MKMTKFFFRVLFLLIVLFFTTGLFIKETTYQVSETIEKPLEEVFAKFNNQATLKLWMDKIIEVTPLEVKPSVVGSSYNMSMLIAGDTLEFNRKIIAYIPNKKITFHFDDINTVRTDDFEFEKKGESTLIVKKTTYKSDSYIMQCAYPYLQNMLSNMDQENLKNFKNYIEKKKEKE